MEIMGEQGILPQIVKAANTLRKETDAHPADTRRRFNVYTTSIRRR